MKTFRCPKCEKIERQPNAVSECWCTKHGTHIRMTEVTPTHAS